MQSASRLIYVVRISVSFFVEHFCDIYNLPFYITLLISNDITYSDNNSMLDPSERDKAWGFRPKVPRSTLGEAIKSFVASAERGTWKDIALTIWPRIANLFLDFGLKLPRPFMYVSHSFCIGRPQHSTLRLCIDRLVALRVERQDKGEFAVEVIRHGEDPAWLLMIVCFRSPFAPDWPAFFDEIYDRALPAAIESVRGSRVRACT